MQPEPPPPLVGGGRRNDNDDDESDLINSFFLPGGILDPEGMGAADGESGSRVLVNSNNTSQPPTRDSFFLPPVQEQSWTRAAQPTAHAPALSSSDLLLPQQNQNLPAYDSSDSLFGSFGPQPQPPSGPMLQRSGDSEDLNTPNWLNQQQQPQGSALQGSVGLPLTAFQSHHSHSSVGNSSLNSQSGRSSVSNNNNDSFFGGAPSLAQSMAGGTLNLGRDESGFSLTGSITTSSPKLGAIGSPAGAQPGIPNIMSMMVPPPGFGTLPSRSAASSAPSTSLASMMHDDQMRPTPDLVPSPAPEPLATQLQQQPQQEPSPSHESKRNGKSNHHSKTKFSGTEANEPPDQSNEKLVDAGKATKPIATQANNNSSGKAPSQSKKPPRGRSSEKVNKSTIASGRSKLQPSGDAASGDADSRQRQQHRSTNGDRKKTEMTARDSDSSVPEPVFLTSSPVLSSNNSDDDDKVSVEATDKAVAVKRDGISGAKQTSESSSRKASKSPPRPAHKQRSKSSSHETRTSGQATPQPSVQASDESASDESASAALAAVLEPAHAFYRWMTEIFIPAVKQTVLSIMLGFSGLSGLVKALRLFGMVTYHMFSYAVQDVQTYETEELIMLGFFQVPMLNHVLMSLFTLPQFTPHIVSYGFLFFLCRPRTLVSASSASISAVSLFGSAGGKRRKDQLSADFAHQLCRTTLLFLQISLPFVCVLEGFEKPETALMRLSQGERIVIFYFLRILRESLVLSPVVWIALLAQSFLARFCQPSSLWLEILFIQTSLAVGMASVRLIKKRAELGDGLHN